MSTSFFSGDLEVYLGTVAGNNRYALTASYFHTVYWGTECIQFDYSSIGVLRKESMFINFTKKKLKAKWDKISFDFNKKSAKLFSRLIKKSKIRNKTELRISTDASAVLAISAENIFWKLIQSSTNILILIKDASNQQKLKISERLKPIFLLFIQHKCKTKLEVSFVDTRKYVVSASSPSNKLMLHDSRYGFILDFLDFSEISCWPEPDLLRLNFLVEPIKLSKLDHLHFQIEYFGKESLILLRRWKVRVFLTLFGSNKSRLIFGSAFLYLNKDMLRVLGLSGVNLSRRLINFITQVKRLEYRNTCEYLNLSTLLTEVGANQRKKVRRLKELSAFIESIHTTF